MNMSQRVIANSAKDLHLSLLNDLEDVTSGMKQIRGKLAQIGAGVFDKVLTELQENKITGYNASIAYTNLVNSICKLEELKMGFFEKLYNRMPLEEQQADAVIENEYEDEMRKIAEECLVHLVKTRIVPKQERLKQEQANSYAPYGNS